MADTNKLHCLGVAVLLMASGCSKSEPKAPGAMDATQPKQEKSTSQVLVDGFTGRGAVETKKAAQATLNKVNAAREKDMKEMDGLLDER